MDDPEKIMRRNRKVLDRVTVDLVRLIARRNAAVIRIGKAKRALGVKILDRKREGAVIGRAEELAKRHKVDKKLVVVIMKMLIKHSRDMQKGRAWE